MYSVLIIFRIEILNLKKKIIFVLYLVRESRSTAPEAYAVLHVLRQDTTVQYTDILKSSLNVFNINLFYFALFYTTYLTGHYALCQSFKQRPQF